MDFRSYLRCWFCLVPLLAAPALAQTPCTTINSLPFTANQANQRYCLAAQPSGSGGLTISASGVTVDGSAARAGRPITDYAAWRSQMKVTSLSVSASGATVTNLDVNGTTFIYNASNSTIQGGTMRAVDIKGTGPVWFLDNIVHYINGNARTKLAADTDITGCGNSPPRSDYVLWGNVFLHESNTDADEPGMYWMHCTAQYIIANNYYAGLSGTNNKQLVRPRNNASYGYIENNMWGFVPSWVTKSVAASTHTPLYFATNGEGDPSSQGMTIRNNISRNNSDNMYLQGIGGSNVFRSNIFIGTGNFAFSSYSSSMGALASYFNNTFVSISGNAVDGTYASGATNLLANNAGSSSSHGFVRATYADGDFHRNCSNPNEYKGAYPCNKPGQINPTTPLNVAAAVMASNRPAGVDLTWDPSSDDEGVIKYIVERAIDCGAFSVIQTGLGPGIIGPAVVDFAAQSGRRYGYRVKAIDADGHESGWSAVAQVGGSGSCGDTQAPAAPMNLRLF